MLGNECLDSGQDGLLFHASAISRVITRTSTDYAGDYTKLRVIARSRIALGMASDIEIDVERLSADMAAHVGRTSARQFSLAATGGSNPDFYRNWINNGQNKRVSAKVFMGIVSALGRDPFDYVVGVEGTSSLPSATVLTATFAVLLDSVGIDPYEGGRAQKLAASFPGALRRSVDLQANALADHSPLLEVDVPDHDEARSTA